MGNVAALLSKVLGSRKKRRNVMKHSIIITFTLVSLGLVLFAPVAAMNSRFGSSAKPQNSSVESQIEKSAEVVEEKPLK